MVTSDVQSYDLTLTRAVAMFRLVLTDEEIPSNVAKLKFYFKSRGNALVSALIRYKKVTALIVSTVSLLVVGITGLEPATSRPPDVCATNCAKSRTLACKRVQR